MQLKKEWTIWRKRCMLVEEWVEEKAMLLEQINDLRARCDLKCDEIEQYSH